MTRAERNTLAAACMSRRYWGAVRAGLCVRCRQRRVTSYRTCQVCRARVKRWAVQSRVDITK